MALSSADLNVDRVANRVATGGHNIPELVIRRRYDVSLKRLAAAIRIAESALVFDNTDTAGPSLLIRISAGKIDANHLVADRPLHLRVAAAVGEALDLPPESLVARAPR